jgi:CheY-like chemotaxis protein
LQNGAFRKPSLLVIDDNVDDIEIVRVALKSLGFEIQMDEALDGEMAIRLLNDKGFRPNFVLLDLKLPGMSGIDVLREIRSDEKFEGLPVFISTCSILDSDISEAMAAGASGYISKSFDIEEFIKDLGIVLQEWLHL